MSQYNMVHKPISMIKAAELPAAKIVIDRDLCERRKKQLTVFMWYCNSHNGTSCGSNTIAVEITTDHTRLKCNNHIINHIDHATSAAHLRFGFYPQNAEHQWKSRSYISYKIGMMLRTLAELRLLHYTVTRYGERPMTHSNTCLHQTHQCAKP